MTTEPIDPMTQQTDGTPRDDWMTADNFIPIVQAGEPIPDVERVIIADGDTMTLSTRDDSYTILPRDD